MLPTPPVLLEVPCTPLSPLLPPNLVPHPAALSLATLAPGSRCGQLTVVGTALDRDARVVLVAWSGALVHTSSPSLPPLVEEKIGGGGCQVFWLPACPPRGRRATSALVSAGRACGRLSTIRQHRDPVWTLAN